MRLTGIVGVVLLLLAATSCGGEGGTLGPVTPETSGPVEEIATPRTDQVAEGGGGSETLEWEPEKCGDGLDNDGNGVIDDYSTDALGLVHECCAVPGQQEACYPGQQGVKPGVGKCTWGSRTCSPSFIWGDCTGYGEPAVELCNCEDDDCDGTADNGADCGAGGVCTNCNCICEPPLVDCGGKCDNLKSSEENCGECFHKCGSDNTQSFECTDGKCFIPCKKGFADCNDVDEDGCEFELAPEQCGDDIDNDCDGKTDDTSVDESGAVRLCCDSPGDQMACFPKDRIEKQGVGECKDGTSTCTEDHTWSDCTGFVGPVQEQCDCKDNDCDNATDEGSCPGNQACDPVLCSCVCPEGLKPCGQECKDFANDAANCGGCGKACPVPAGGLNVAPTCEEQKCGLKCFTGFVDCNGDLMKEGGNGCEVNSTVQDFCGDLNGDKNLDDDCDGSEDEDGSKFPHAECQWGADVCSQGYTDCGPGGGELDCVDLKVDLDNCGLCGAVCGADNPGDTWYPHSQFHVLAGACIQQVCEISACDAGWFDLDKLAYTGCECGAKIEECNCEDDDCDGIVDDGDLCDKQKTGRSCLASCECGCSLPTPDWCDTAGKCVDTLSDPNHCGFCGKSCLDELANTKTALCEVGNCCPTSCVTGYADCDKECFNGCEFKITDEVCNGEDDNCNGAIDEKFPGQGEPCDSQEVGVCTPGKWVCQDGLKVCKPNIAPGSKAETCNGLDDDCNGVADDGLENMGPCVAVGYKGICAEGIKSCKAGSPECLPGTAHLTDDICNSKDDDCDGSVDEDEGADGCKTYYWDNDSDYYGDPMNSKCLCKKQDKFTTEKAGDCNDGDPAIHEGAKETCDGVDENCVGGVDDGVPPKSCTSPDICGNGSQECFLGLWGDCVGTPKKQCTNYADCSTYMACSCNTPPAEKCDNKDNDCDGDTDEGVKTTYYKDNDADGYGSSKSGTTEACSVPANYSSNNQDCDDNDPKQKPGATETCNNEDDDCDGATDEGVQTTYYKDSDADGYGSSSSGTKQACSLPSGYSTNNTDCDDSNKSINPGAKEVCDNMGKDEDCDKQTDEGCAIVQLTVYNNFGELAPNGFSANIAKKSDMIIIESKSSTKTVTFSPIEPQLEYNYEVWQTNTTFCNTEELWGQTFFTPVAGTNAFTFVRQSTQDPHNGLPYASGVTACKDGWFSCDTVQTGYVFKVGDEVRFTAQIKNVKSSSRNVEICVFIKVQGSLPSGSDCTGKHSCVTGTVSGKSTGNITFADYALATTGNVYFAVRTRDTGFTGTVYTDSWSWTKFGSVVK